MKIARLGLRIAGCAVVPAFLGFVAVFWIGFTYSDSIDLGPGFIVFLAFVYLVFTFLTLRIQFLPKASWPRYILAYGISLGFMAVWFVVVCWLCGADSGVILQHSFRN